MLDRFVVSQRFVGDGPWIVHLPGPSREYKIAYCADKEQAEKIALALNNYLENRDHSPTRVRAHTSVEGAPSG